MPKEIGKTIDPGSSHDRSNKARLDDHTREEIPAPSSSNVKRSETAVSECKNPGRIAGSTPASQPTFQQMWISRAEYDKYGPSIIHRRCF
ncbi:hypothetical protein GCK32_012086 [Trichostrongylus colubriformis]|uniref:Uncharacterized protein n=1 Tax=Trichostrongylus colubriformis TaxID=6319 RepID=A0AAN8GBR1_TRICO